MAEPKSQASTAAPLTVGTIVVVIAAAFIGLKPGPTGPDVKPPGKAEPVEEGVSLSGEEPHRRFILGQDGTAAEAAEGGVRPGEAKPRGGPAAQAGRPSLCGLNCGDEELLCLVATVPDPIDTPFGFWYDQAVESLSRAVCDAGDYVPGRQWSPWEQYRLQARRHGAAPAAESSPPALFEKYPGVLLFHGKGKSDRRMAVLLVGETPKGIRTEALRRALEVALEVADDKAKSGGGGDRGVRVRLIAPWFTGSLPSLRRTLGHWKGALARKPSAPPFQLDVITGTANGIRPDAVEEWMGDKGAARSVTFRSTVLPSEFLRNAAVHFLKKGAADRGTDVSADLRAEDVKGVAFLLESNTGYGRAELTALPWDNRAQVRGVEGPRGDSAPPRWPVFLPYPLHLSRLQAKYTKERIEKEKRFGLPSTLLPGEGRRGPRSNPDLLTPLDDVMTPSITDRAVDDVTASIRQKRARFVGILSTDPEDKVFLVEKIKKDCPNVTVFITGNDLFYALPENRYTMRNVLISATYPLTPYNQWWTEPEERRGQTFRSEVAQGVYNAAAAHLASWKCRTPEAVLQEYAPPVFAWRGDCRPSSVLPPAWILTLGDDGRFVPLGFYDRFQDPRAAAATRLMVSSGLPSRVSTVEWPGLGSFRVLVTVVLVAVTVLLAWLLRGRECREGRVVAGGMDDEGQRLVCYKVLALAAAVFALLPILSVLLILLGPWYERSGWGTTCLIALAAVVTLSALGCLFFQGRLLYRYLLRGEGAPGMPSPRDGVFAVRFGGSLLLVAVEVVLLTSLVIAQVSADGAVKVLFVQRASSVLTGYSVLPSVLLLAAGFAAYAYHAIHRCYIGRRFHIVPPYPCPDERKDAASPDFIVARNCRAIGDLASSVHGELTSAAAFGRKRWPALGLVVAAYALVAWAILTRAQRTWEGFWYDEPFAAGFFVLGGLVLLTVWRFIDCWHGVKDVLKKMALVPMVRAFDRLPRKTASLFGGYFFARKPRASHLVIPLHVLHEMRVALERSERSERSGPAVPVERSGRPIEASWRTSPQPSGPKRLTEEEYPGEQINMLSEMAAVVVSALRKEWPRHTVTDAFGEQASDPTPAPGPAKGSDGPDGPPEWVKKAEDFVAIQAIIFLSQYFILLRSLVGSMVTGSVLLLLAATSYPFQPEKLILYLLLGLLAAVCGSILYVFVEINKDEVVSRITQSTPNRFELNWSFAASVAQYVGPIVVILVGHFSGRLRTLIEPLYELLH